MSPSIPEACETSSLLFSIRTQEIFKQPMKLSVALSCQERAVGGHHFRKLKSSAGASMNRKTDFESVSAVVVPKNFSNS